MAIENENKQREMAKAESSRVAAFSGKHVAPRFDGSGAHENEKAAA